MTGDLRITFSADVDKIPKEEIVRAAMECTRQINPYFSLKVPWGAVEFVPLEVSSLFGRETILYSPFFLEQAFGWNSQTTDFDGLCAIVRNDSSVKVGRAELPFSLRWRAEAELAIERKARSIQSLLGDAISQIPVGEGGFVYIAYDDLHRADVADRRTERILELAKGFEVRKRGIRPPLMIVITRLFSNALGDGRPDLIESSLSMTPEENNNWDGLMPARIFT